MPGRGRGRGGSAAGPATDSDSGFGARRKRLRRRPRRAVHSAAAGSRRPADSARNPAKASPRRWVTVRLTRIPARGPAQAPPRPRRRSSWQPACRTRARAAAGQAQPGSLRPPRRRATVRVACRTDAVRCVADRSKMSNPIQLRLQPRGPRAAAAAP